MDPDFCRPFRPAKAIRTFNRYRTYRRLRGFISHVAAFTHACESLNDTVGEGASDRGRQGAVEYEITERDDDSSQECVQVFGGKDRKR
jgi:hypothetical protein